MLSEIVDKVVRQVVRHYRTRLEVSDLRQEAWLVILEAQKDGIIDPKAMERKAFNHLLNLAKKESRRRDFPSEIATL